MHYEKNNYSFSSNQTDGKTLQEFRDSIFESRDGKWNGFNTLYKQTQKRLNLSSSSPLVDLNPVVNNFEKMNLKEIHTFIGNEWIKIIGISDELKIVLSDFDGDNLIGYVYIDHTAGVTLEIIKLFDIQGKEIIYRESPSDKNIRVISRLDGILRSKEIHLVPNELIEELNLKIPEYLSSYERPDLIKFRLDNNFHKFRGDGFPDDIQILLPATNGLEPELIWGRVEKFDNSNLTCQLLNQPYQNFGVKINDMLYASIQNIEGNDYVVCNID